MNDLRSSERHLIEVAGRLDDLCVSRNGDDSRERKQQALSREKDGCIYPYRTREPHGV